MAPRCYGPAALTAAPGDSLLSLAWLMLCVAAIIVLAYLFTKYVAGRSGVAAGLGGGSRKFKVLHRLALGRDQAIMLVRVGERFLLLGVAASGISLLAELTGEEAEALNAPDPGEPAPPSFGEALRGVLKQRKPR